MIMKLPNKQQTRGKANFLFSSLVGLYFLLFFYIFISVYIQLSVYLCLFVSQFFVQTSEFPSFLPSFLPILFFPVSFLSFPLLSATLACVCIQQRLHIFTGDIGGLRSRAKLEHWLHTHSWAMERAHAQKYNKLEQPNNKRNKKLLLSKSLLYS